MSGPLLTAWANVPKPIVGMLHLPPLPGSPGFTGDVAAILSRVLHDAEALAEGGVHGLTLENFGDVPFYPGRVPPHVVAHMTRIAHDLRRQFDLPLGINVLRNDACSALAVAHAVGASFVRVNVLCGARVTDQGVVQAVAHDLLRQRAMLGASRIRIFADVDVKHSAPLGIPRPVDQQVREMVHRGGADAVIATGAGTGLAPDIGSLREIKAASGGAFVFAGSGVAPGNVRECLAHVDGVIVGTSLKVDGVVLNPVDPDRVRALVSAAR